MKQNEIAEKLKKHFSTAVDLMGGVENESLGFLYHFLLDVGLARSGMRDMQSHVPQRGGADRCRTVPMGSPRAYQSSAVSPPEWLTPL